MNGMSSCKIWTLEFGDVDFKWFLTFKILTF